MNKKVSQQACQSKIALATQIVTDLATISRILKAGIPLPAGHEWVEDLVDPPLAAGPIHTTENGHSIRIRRELSSDGTSSHMDDPDQLSVKVRVFFPESKYIGDSGEAKVYRKGSILEARVWVRTGPQWAGKGTYHLEAEVVEASSVEELARRAVQLIAEHTQTGLAKGKQDDEAPENLSWSVVCEHFGLDESFQYSETEQQEYYRLLRDGEVRSGPTAFPVGTVVGARRWPYSASHPDCWGKPWQGVVLAINDQRAWAGNAALDTQSKIDAHVAWCQEHGLLKHTIPVLWDFDDEQVVYFQQAVGDASLHDLMLYAEDYSAWQSARAEARKTRS